MPAEVRAESALIRKQKKRYSRMKEFQERISYLAFGEKANVGLMVRLRTFS
jgi:hypothetical protein